MVMQGFEYKIVPAPRRAAKVKGVKLTEDRFAHTLTDLVNAMARDGWEYLRADTLPVEERVGLTGKTTTFQHMLVFRRALSRPESRFEDPATSPKRLVTQDPENSAETPIPQVRLFSRPEPGQAPALGAAGERGGGHAAE